MQKLEETLSDMIRTSRKMLIEDVQVKDDLGKSDGEIVEIMILSSNSNRTKHAKKKSRF